MQLNLLKPRLQVGDGVVIRHEVIELLREIGKQSSIAGAAREREMEFRTAWGFIQDLNAALEKPAVIVVKMQGPGGRGSQLTPLGIALIEEFDKIDSACQAAARRGIAAIRRQIDRAPDAFPTDDQ
ncbi:ModE family transcriptional regulator [Cupriavidus sp. BIC8F]|uniref:winged helix-turn-helix domain-containing protein n=1 Tax=Cupriavidus sp. BIC8F TaxID=3079014 RepID=UPI0029160A41|nr:ModE family transcriptional regulator [Cupriavidus sp. BIC8F]